MSVRSSASDPLRLYGACMFPSQSPTVVISRTPLVESVPLIDDVESVYPLRLSIDPDMIALPDDILIVSAPENDPVILIKF